MSLLVLLSVASAVRVRSVNDKLETINQVHSVRQRYAINFRGSVHDRAIDARDMVLVSDQEVEGVAADIDRLAAKYAQSAGPMNAMLAPGTNPSAGELEILAGIKDVERRTLPLIQRVIAQRRAGDIEGARTTLLNDGRPLFVEWLKQINRFIDLQEAMNRNIAAEVSAATSTFMILIGTLCLCGLGIGLLVVRWSMRGVKALPHITDIIRRLGEGDRTVSIPLTDASDELGDLARATAAFRDQIAGAEQAKEEQTELLVTSVGSALARLAKGDLATRIESDLTGPFVKLKSDFNEAVTSLSSAMHLVAAGALNMRTGSDEIAVASEDLARRAERDAASLAETAASIGQMEERLKATATSAAETVSRADGTIAVVDSGRTVANEAVDAMDRVSESARGIDSVIEGLDKIAFQTRVLAMNAAVEAGRAGEAGRGFAVVADLVSALAMRAEEEAKRARDQLTLTQSDIVTAVDAVQRVDGALERISSGVADVHALLGTIATDNQVQASTIARINATISDMDRSVQQNAAMVEESSAGARNLAFEAGRLAQQVDRFETGSQLAQSASTSGSVRAVQQPLEPLSAVH